MALLNIGASNRDDAFYRYKMPRMITKVEGRGNGIKTNIVNMVDVAKALARSPAYTTKFFGCELGAQSRFDDKTGTAIVNGSHDTAKLAALLEIFIKKYVQCYECRNPETEILISKSQMISLKCAACGFVSDVDMRDKLTTFILKNPPEQKKKDKKGMRRAEKERLKEGEAADEESKKGRKDSKPKKIHDGSNGHVSKKVSDRDVEVNSPASSHKDDSEDEDEAGEDDVEWQTDTSVSAAQQRIKEQLTAATSELVMLDNATVDNMDEKKIKLIKKISSVDAIDPPLPLNAPNAYKGLVDEFRKCLDDGLISKQLVERFHSVQPRISDEEAMKAYFEALFQGTSRGLVNEIKRKKLFLSEAVTTDHAQCLLLRAIESFCSSGSIELQKEIPVVLKKLYDLDIIEEDAVFAWYNDKNILDGISVKKFAKPFVEWLQSAESEEDE